MSPEISQPRRLGSRLRRLGPRLRRLGPRLRRLGPRLRRLGFRLYRLWTADRIRLAPDDSAPVPRPGDRLQWGSRVFRVVPGPDGEAPCLALVACDPGHSRGPDEAPAATLCIDDDGRWCLEFPDRTRLPVEPSDCIVYRIAHYSPGSGTARPEGT